MIKNAEEIKEDAPIEAIIGEFVKLEKKGKDYKGCCPFHNEKTPSFTVSIKKGMYKCFGCGESGDTIQFLMDHEAMTYPEALEHVAKYRNILIEYEQQGKRPEIIQQERARKEKREAQLEVLKKVAKAFFVETWGDALHHHGIIDVFGRWYTNDTLKQFGVSYSAPAKLLKSLEVDQEALLATGLLREGKAFFHERLMFPIFDYRSRVVGFAGRITGKRKGPKYLNSPESTAYGKEEQLYGIHAAKRAIQLLDLIILVEGYTDAMTLYEFGIYNVVATCGTAFTEKQAQLVKRFTKNVLILRDGDAAGKKAAIKDVTTCVENGLRPKVVLLEDGEDPDSFLRKTHERLLSELPYKQDYSTKWAYRKPKAKEVFDQMIEYKLEDGILWRIMLDWGEDNFQKENAYDIAGELLCHLSESLQESYLRDLTKKGRMGAVKIQLKSCIKRHSEEKLKKSDLSKEQVTDIVYYGIYERKNQYFISQDTNNGVGVSISNFIIKPLLLIIGANYSQRLIEIINIFGNTAILNLDSTRMTSMTDFKKEVETKGNFVFRGKSEAYDKVKSKVYANFIDCFPIQTMGAHKEGFYTWGNGISVNGAFKPIDENGIITYNKTRYFLPAFSRIHDKIKSDDMEEEFEFEKKWSFYPSPKSINFEEWTRRMVEVHGSNGGLAVAFYLASLFRDSIFGKFNFFPILNHFGPSGSGKSYCAESIMAMFGKGTEHEPFSLNSGTNVAFYRRLAQVRNGIVFFDEYSNDVDHKRIEAIKDSWGGIGRQKGVASNDNRTVTTKIRAGLIVAGQQQATKDIAAFNRMVSLNFQSGVNSIEQQHKGEALKEIEKTGQLTQLTQKLLTYRPWVDEQFKSHFRDLKMIFKSALNKAGNKVSDRVLNNHLILLATAMIISEKENFGFDLNHLSEWVFDNIITQTHSIQNEDEISIFWRIFDYLVQSHQAMDGVHFCVEMKQSEKYKDPTSNDRNAVILKNYEEFTMLLYITFSKIHPDYQERHQRQRGKNGLDLGALMIYLQGSDAYEGKIRAKRVGGRTRSVHVFDANKLPIQVDLSPKEKGSK